MNAAGRSAANMREELVMEKIWLATPTMHGEEMVFVQEAFDKNWIAPLGFNVDSFERELAEYVGISHAAALNTGTAALHMAVKLSGIQREDIVLCSDLTFAATANPVVYEGGTPVFIDCERESWNMDPMALEKALKKYGNRVKAVIVVHLYGTPAKMDEICALCNQYNVILIEDAAESLGATYKGKQTGTFGQYSAVSFNGNKVITTSGGGMLLSDDEEGIGKARFWSTQSRENVPWYQHNEIGYNYRMSNVLAGIGRGQLRYLKEHIERKKEIYRFYAEKLNGLPVTMNPYLANTEPNNWLSCLLIDTQAIQTVTPEQLRLELEKSEIESRPIWKPMHLQPVFRDCDFISNEQDTGADIFARGLCLPSDIKMTTVQQERVVEAIRRCFEKSE